jgi:hypothetical protein
MFMSTSHQDGSGVQFGKLIVNISSTFIATDNRLLQHLERDSEWLQQQYGQYEPIGEDFVTKFAYEEYAALTMFDHSINGMSSPFKEALPVDSADGNTSVSCCAWRG